jgi:Sodium:sulfate symporter transmembrane region
VGGSIRLGQRGVNVRIATEERNMVDQDGAGAARALMPQLRTDLEALVRIPSVSVPGRIDQSLLDAFEMTSRLFTEAGVTVGRLDLPEMGVSEKPILMAVAVSAAASFLTPIATPANLMVMGPGGYRFGDYWKLGLPLLTLFGVVAVLLVPVFWPL